MCGLSTTGRNNSAVDDSARTDFDQQPGLSTSCGSGDEQRRQGRC